MAGFYGLVGPPALPPPTQLPTLKPQRPQGRGGYSRGRRKPLLAATFTHALRGRQGPSAGLSPRTPRDELEEKLQLARDQAQRLSSRRVLREPLEKPRRTLKPLKPRDLEADARPFGAFKNRSWRIEDVGKIFPHIGSNASFLDCWPTPGSIRLKCQEHCWTEPKAVGDVGLALFETFHQRSREHVVVLHVNDDYVVCAASGLKEVEEPGGEGTAAGDEQCTREAGRHFGKPAAADLAELLAQIRQVAPRLAEALEDDGQLEYQHLHHRVLELGTAEEQVLAQPLVTAFVPTGSTGTPPKEEKPKLKPVYVCPFKELVVAWQRLDVHEAYVNTSKVSCVCRACDGGVDCDAARFGLLHDARAVAVDDAAGAQRWQAVFYPVEAGAQGCAAELRAFVRARSLWRPGDPPTAPRRASTQLLRAFQAAERFADGVQVVLQCSVHPSALGPAEDGLQDIRTSQAVPTAVFLRFAPGLRHTRGSRDSTS